MVHEVKLVPKNELITWLDIINQQQFFKLISFGDIGFQAKQKNKQRSVVSAFLFKLSIFGRLVGQFKDNTIGRTRSFTIIIIVLIITNPKLTVNIII